MVRHHSGESTRGAQNLDCCLSPVSLMMRGKTALSGDGSADKVGRLAFPHCQEASHRAQFTFSRDKSERLHVYIARFRVAAERVEEHGVLLAEPVFP